MNEIFYDCEVNLRNKKINKRCSGKENPCHIILDEARPQCLEAISKAVLTLIELDKAETTN